MKYSKKNFFNVTSHFLFLFIVCSDIKAEENCTSSLSVTDVKSVETKLADLHATDVSLKESFSVYPNDDLLCTLLSLRLSSHPRIAPRSEKLLLSYLATSSSKITTTVKNALIEDVANKDRIGLASVILSNLNLVENDFSSKLRLQAENAVSVIASQKSSDESSKLYKSRVSALLAEK